MPQEKGANNIILVLKLGRLLQRDTKQLSLNEEGISVAVRGSLGLGGEKLCSRDLACTGDHYIPTVGMMVTQERMEKTNEKEANTYTEYPRMDVRRQSECGFALVLGMWPSRSCLHHHLPRNLVRDYTHSFAIGERFPARQSPLPNGA